MGGGRKFVVSADKTIMSHYRGNMLFGFLASFPSEKVNPYIYKKIFSPTVSFDKTTGKALFAPLGIRRIESGLMKSFDQNDVLLAHPEQLKKSIGNETKIVGLEVMDPFGIGPVPSTNHGGDLNPINKVTFKRLCQEVKKLKEKNGFKVVVGGAGSWQLSFDKALREDYGIDHVVVGEGDNKVGEIYEEILAEKSPDVILSHTETIDDIPYILGPTCNGLIEAMRGCGRNCDFCDPNLRKKRDFPIERIKKEAMINIKHGLNSVWLQSEEILLYGIDNSQMQPNKDAVINLFKEIKSLPKVDYVGTMHLTFSSAMAEPECITKMSEINNFGPGRWVGIQTGLETASASLIKKHMASKVKPFSPEEWPWVVREGIKLLNDNFYFSVNSIVIGLPGELDEDVQETIELIKGLDDMATIIVPLLYTDYQNPNNSITSENMTRTQWELLYCCWLLNAKAVTKWIWEGTSRFNPVMRTFASLFAKFGIWYWLRLIRDTAKKQSGVELM